MNYQHFNEKWGKMGVYLCREEKMARNKQKKRTRT